MVTRAEAPEFKPKTATPREINNLGRTLQVHGYPNSRGEALIAAAKIMEIRQRSVAPEVLTPIYIFDKATGPIFRNNCYSSFNFSLK